MNGSTKQLAMLLGTAVVILIITHWPTFVDAEHVSHDEYEKVTKAAVTLIGSMLAVFTAWKFATKDKDK